jgi:hypothetical protein
MRNSLYILFLILSFFCLISCHCKTCTDNITEANKKIPYKDKDLVAFKNDTLGVVSDTVRVNLGAVSTASYDCYGSSGDAEQKYCTTFSEINYSNTFEIQIVQAPNSSKNIIVYAPLNPYDKEKIESISYYYKNEKINAYHFYNNIDSLGSKIWNGKDSNYVVYNDYYYTTENTVKLLQYSKVYKDGKRRVFKLID